MSVSLKQKQITELEKRIQKLELLINDFFYDTYCSTPKTVILQELEDYKIHLKVLKRQ